MPIDGLDDAAIRAILTSVRRVAVVGASANQARPSYGVMQVLLGHGYTVIPVNPSHAGRAILGQQTVATLAEAKPLDMVDVFRNQDDALGVVDEAIRLGARVIWLQLGVINHTAAAHAKEAGVALVMDRCPAIELGRLGLGPRH